MNLYFTKGSIMKTENKIKIGPSHGKFEEHCSKGQW